jgi:hypothetical protein
MTIAKIRAALETHLGTITPVIPTAFENVKYDPVVGVPYQKSFLKSNTPDDGQISSQTYFERGFYQVTLFYPLGTGPALAEARAQLIKDAFKRGTSVFSGGVTVIIMNAPSVSGSMVDGDRFTLPITINFQSQITVT